MIKFGNLGDSRNTLCDDISLIRTNKFTSLGIDYDIMELNTITELNLKPKLLEIKKLCKIWQLRNLSLIEKINIIKSLMFSKIVHILLFLPSPETETFDEIENIFLSFLWKGKPHKFKLTLLEKLTAEGGLQFLNIKKIEMTLKASWFKRIYKFCEGWASFPNMYSLNGEYKYGNIYIKNIYTKIGNKFWANATLALYTIYNCAKYSGEDSILSIPLWYTQRVMEGKIQKLSIKGLNTRGDLRGEDGNMISIEEIQIIIYEKCNFLLYIRINKKKYKTF